MKNKSTRNHGFKAVLSFEYMSYLKNKAFIVTTIVILVLMVIASFIPAIIIAFSSGGEEEEPGEKPKIALVNNAYEQDAAIVSAFEQNFEGNEIVVTDDSIDTIKSDVTNGEYEFAIVLDEPLSYQYITNETSIFDSTDSIDSAITYAYRTTELEKNGISAEQSEKLLNTFPKGEVITLGADQTASYFSTYILVLFIYMAIIMYGQMVCNSVVTEKSTRAMELLITCARPSDLMFGKVLGAGLAGFTQIAAILGVGLLSFSFSASSIPSEISSIFSLPVSSVLYAILFFVLAFFVYAFVMAALASLVSKPEDLNTILTPIMMVVIIAMMVVVVGMNTGELNSPLMIATSYIPFTAPFSMFARITMSNVAAWEIILSVAIQVVSIYLLGRLAAAVYRIGVLLYGKPPRFNELFKMLARRRGGSKPQ